MAGGNADGGNVGIHHGCQGHAYYHVYFIFTSMAFALSYAHVLMARLSMVLSGIRLRVVGIDIHEDQFTGEHHGGDVAVAQAT